MYSVSFSLVLQSYLVYVENVTNTAALSAIGVQSRTANIAYANWKRRCPLSQYYVISTVPWNF